MRRVRARSRAQRRIEAFGLKALLTSTTPSVSASLGTLGRFVLSAALVVELQHIFGDASANWSHATLYVPSFIPFWLVAVATMLRHRMPLRAYWHVLRDTCARLQKVLRQQRWRH